MQRTGLTHGRVSQLFDERQPFGEAAARNLAERLGLAPDYFERDQPGVVEVQAPAERPSGCSYRNASRALRVLPDEEQERLMRDTMEAAARYDA